MHQKPFVPKIHQSPFLIPSASTFRSQEGTVFLWMLEANPNCLFASRIQIISQDPHDHGYECSKCFTSLATSFSHGSKQKWLNIHGSPEPLSARQQGLSLHSAFLGQPGCRDNCLLAASQILHHPTGSTLVK